MKEQKFTASAEGKLLDCLLANMKQSRNNVKTILGSGQVLVDGRKTTKFDYPVKVGSVITVRPPVAKGEKLPFQILHEDEDILVIDKPAGLLSMANEKEKERTAYHMVTEYMANKVKHGRVFIIHRLDRDTSGVLMFAKSEAVKRLYQDNWDKNIRRRGYLAMVEGTVKEPSGTIKSTLRETVTHMVYSVEDGAPGKEAITHFVVKKTGNGHSLLEVDIDTGRKNQIRVHLSDMGHPIVGDKFYGASTNPLGRMGLHAHVLELEHPKTGELISFKAPIPGGFNGMMNTGR